MACLCSSDTGPSHADQEKGTAMVYLLALIFSDYCHSIILKGDRSAMDDEQSLWYFPQKAGN